MLEGELLVEFIEEMIEREKTMQLDEYLKSAF